MVYTKLQAQIETHIARQQSGLVSLMGCYNTLCNELENLIHSRKAPRGSIAPKPLERESLFHLDIDDPIWDDAGLYEPDANGMIPPWLGDDTVWKGIQAWLAVERCTEELERLKDECSSLHTWLQDEWTILINSRSAFQETSALLYQWELRKEYLSRLCISWRKDIGYIPYAKMDERWGPEEQQARMPGTTVDLGGTSDDDANSDSDYSSEIRLADDVVQEMELLNLDRIYSV
ncbi:hypothetical protein BKA70DRAFT_1439363 [Coprinopsis sp. MPI-PUGE-AT-0042]|nr:hypothetical protein BKA70DRAFT_1439363 [Coprinopsis sp. MPI-PUGE-AT-0042]